MRSSSFLRKRKGVLVWVAGLCVLGCGAGMAFLWLFALPSLDKMRADFPVHRDELECFKVAIQALPPGTLMDRVSGSLVGKCSTGFVKGVWGQRENWSVEVASFHVSALDGGFIGYKFVEPPDGPDLQHKEHVWPLEAGWYIWFLA